MPRLLTGNSIWFSSVILLLVMSPLLTDGPSNRETLLQHLTKGDEFYHSFDNERALIEYEQAYDVAPDSFATNERLVIVYNDTGRLRLHKDESSESTIEEQRHTLIHSIRVFRSGQNPISGSP